MAHEYTTWAYQQRVEQPLAKFVLVCLADAADSSGRSFPGQKRLSEMTGMGIRTLRRHLERLEELGYVRREERRRKDGTRTSDEYQLPFKDSTGQIGPLFTTGQIGRLQEHTEPADHDAQYPQSSTGQIGPLSAPRSTGQIRQGHRPNWPVDGKPPSDPSSTTQTPSYQPANLAGHEPINHQKEPPLPPQPLHEPPIEDEAEAERGDLEDLTHYQRRQLEKPPDRLKSSQLATEFPKAWAQLANFRRLHARPVPAAQFATWAAAVLDDAREHGDALVSAALQVANENFPNLNQPFAFYRACVRRAASDTSGRNGDLSAPAVMSQADLDRMFELAKEGALS